MLVIAIFICLTKIILSSWIHFVFKINRFMPILSNLNKLIWNKCQNQINANNKLLSFFCFECRNHMLHLCTTDKNASQLDGHLICNSNTSIPNLGLNILKKKNQFLRVRKSIENSHGNPNYSCFSTINPSGK